MFSGLIQEIGSVKNIIKNELNILEIKFSQVNQCNFGDSVSINGVCLSITQINLELLTATFQVIPETLKKT